MKSKTSNNFENDFIDFIDKVTDPEKIMEARIAFRDIQGQLTKNELKLLIIYWRKSTSGSTLGVVELTEVCNLILRRHKCLDSNLQGGLTSLLFPLPF